MNPSATKDMRLSAHAGQVCKQTEIASLNVSRQERNQHNKWNFSLGFKHHGALRTDWNSKQANLMVIGIIEDDTIGSQNTTAHLLTKSPVGVMLDRSKLDLNKYEEALWHRRVQEYWQEW